MDAIPDAYADFGQTLAFTERTMTEVLRDHLAERGVQPETWYALKLTAQGAPKFSRRSLIGNLKGSRGLDASSIDRLLERLATEGLIAGDDTLELTRKGKSLFDSLRAHVLGATVNLLGQFDLGDIETTVRTLKGITQLGQGVSESPA
jgi:DNA-binding MarR family transcriptional regulator